jgi:Tfp pilus assembly protein PilW
MSSFLRRLRDERGTSLIELVIVSAVSLVILGAVLSMLESGTKTERGTEARHSALLALRGGLVRIDKDLRQATSVASTSTTSHLDICTYISGSPKHVVYDIASGTLTRKISSTDCAGAVGTATPLVSHVTTTAAFCYDPPDCSPTADPTAATKIRVTIAATPEVFSGGPITLATDIDLRNI